MPGARPGLEKFKMPGPGSGPGRDRNLFYCRGRAGIGIFFIAGAGPGFKFFIAGVAAGPGSKILK